jgi:hypothetical protein
MTRSQLFGARLYVRAQPVMASSIARGVIASTNVPPNRGRMCRSSDSA